MDELTVLREAFDPDEVPADAARARARTALLARTRPQVVARPRWVLRVGIPAAVAAAVAVGGVVVVSTRGHHGTVAAVGATASAGTLPFAHPATAVEYLENAAWTAHGQKWTTPRPDQFMYRETKVLLNDKALLASAPNGPLVPGRSSYVDERHWNRIDAKVMATMEDGKLVVQHQGEEGMSWGQVAYDEISGLDTPAKVVAWQNGPHPREDATLLALLSQYVLPPDVQAAMYRTLAQQPGVRLDPDTVNLDGRPAIGLGTTIEGYLSQELLFDKATYALIGERQVAYADHKNVGDDGTSYTHKGDVFRMATYVESRIVDNAGDTK